MLSSFALRTTTTPATRLQHEICRAAEALKHLPYIQETRLQQHGRLSKLLGANILVKHEADQKGGAYKNRGGSNVVGHFTEAEKDRGAILASAGNHAIGAGLACGHFGVDCHMVMPEGTAAVKKQKIVECSNGRATFEEFGHTFDEANLEALRQAGEFGRKYIHPFDDPLTIAGQGTIAEELYRQAESPIDRVYVPLGGGGLVSGISEWTQFASPQTTVYGVEPVESAAMHASVSAGTRVTLDKDMSTFVDGAAVRSPGMHTFECVRRNRVRLLQVTEQDASRALVDLLDEDGIHSELAGALPFAALMQHSEELRGKTAVVILSGKNIDPEKLEKVRKRVR